MTWQQAYNGRVREFTVVDLTAQCEVKLKAQYAYELLEKIDGAIDLISLLSREIWRSPEQFEVPLRPGDKNMVLRWGATAATAGIATLRGDEKTLSLSLLASGIDPEADRVTLHAFQQFAVRELHDTGFEPSFDLLGLKERPLVATIGLSAPQNAPDQWVFALADRCFAAAYFRRLGLA